MADFGLHTLKPAPGSRKDRKRVGRGEGSGTGKTAGRGQKGYGARSGAKRRARFEGGQNPINLVKATVAGLQGLRTPDEVAELRGLSINQVLGVGGEPQAAETLSGAPAEPVANGTTEAAEEAAGADAGVDTATEAPPAGEGEGT